MSGEPLPYHEERILRIRPQAARAVMKCALRLFADKIFLQPLHRFFFAFKSPAFGDLKLPLVEANSDTVLDAIYLDTRDPVFV